MTIRPASDRSLLVSFGNEITLEAHHLVGRLTDGLEGRRGILVPCENADRFRSRAFCARLP